MKYVTLQSRETGAALVVSLVLLLVLTVLGVSGMNTATMELRMAGNTQIQEDSFEMAEDAIDIGIAQRNFTTVAPTNVNPLGTPNADRQAQISFATTTPVPDVAFSMGTSTGSVQAFHFDIVAVGQGSGGATSTHTQSFYVVGPGGS